VDEAVGLALRRPPDLLVLDVRLGPEDGLAVLRRLPAGSRAQVLACTGVGDEVPGVDAVLRKPFSVQGLVDAVDALARRLPS